MLNPKDCQKDQGNSTDSPAGKGSVSPDNSSGKSGRTDLQQLAIKSVSATSNSSRHQSQFVADGTEKRRWCTKQNQLNGQSLRLSFEGKPTLYRLSISVPQLKKNVKITSLRTRFSDGSSQSFSLNGSWGVQTLDLDPVSTDFVSVEFVEVTKQSDTKKAIICVAEAQAFGISP